MFRSAAPAAFLTGNLPLVHVLREALARDAKGPGVSLRAANHRLDSAIQPLLGFLRDNVPRAALSRHAVGGDPPQGGRFVAGEYLSGPALPGAV
ncbi:hypothetical protein [Acidocella sp. C78]|uniref:hypothetical protein n=1 Tax=Acidocella sp. C78 TaxID=1671486 RepID=UPI0020BECB57|nr:hypothetical protein [Acidocella sp. C78]